MKISVNSKVRLNGIGIVGAILFVGSPIVAGLTYMRTMEEVARSLRYGFQPKDMSEMATLALYCSIAALIGFVMLLVGREYDHRIEIERE